MVRPAGLGFELSRTDEALTAHGGLVLMAAYSERLGLRALSDLHLPAPGSNRGYRPSVFVESLVLMFQGGGRRLEDLRTLEGEGALMGLIGRDRIPDADTMGDWLRRMGGTEAERLGLEGCGRLRDALNGQIMKREPRRDFTLDADATQIEAMKRDAAWTYQGVQGYMPMLGFLFENGLCLHDEFRAGNASPAAGQVAFYSECKARMTAGKRIARYRADSASYQAALINTLEADGVVWAVTADQDRAVKGLIGALGEAEWKTPEADCGYEVAETVHTMNKTDRAFRLVIKREVRHAKDLFDTAGEHYFYHAVASNWPEEEKSAVEVLAWHNQRGSAENFNKELKCGLGMEQMPCGQFGANAVFFRLGVVAYNLFVGFKQAACPEAWRTHTIATLRWKFIQVAGRIVRHAGRTILKLAVDAKRFLDFEGMGRRCLAISAVT